MPITHRLLFERYYKKVFLKNHDFRKKSLSEKSGREKKRRV